VDRISHVTARAAYAVAADVQRQLGDRRERGGWYRVSLAGPKRMVRLTRARLCELAVSEAGCGSSSAGAASFRARGDDLTRPVVAPGIDVVSTAAEASVSRRNVPVS
jgi:hypothetical protein